MDKTVRQNTKLFAVLTGLFFSYLITAFILLLLSFLMLKLNLPGAGISAGIIAAYIISNLVGGFLVGRKAEQRKFIWGFIMGVFYFVILMLISLLMNRAESLPLGNLFTAMIICSMSGMVGGMLS